MIPVHEPLLTDAERQYVLGALDSGWISGEGPYVQQFENRWAAYCGCKYGVAVNTGTAALYTAMAVLGVKGREVILPSFTIISCAQAVLAAGGIPVLVDCDPGTWCMDVQEVARKITDQTAAVMPVHIYGHPVDMDELRDVVELRSTSIAVVEDAAEAHGARYKGETVGGLGDVSCFSFYSNKIVTTGEGGMLVTNRESIARRAREHRNLCFRQPRFEHLSLGNNYRLPNLSAAMGLGQLDHLEERLKIRRAIAMRYHEQLGTCEQLRLPVERPWAKNVYWMYGVVVDESWGTAVQLAEALEQHGIQTRPFFKGMHEQPALRSLGLFRNESYPVTERISRQGLYLPSGFTLTEEQIATVCKELKRVLSRPAA
jgi:perosamine synthetase